MQIQGWLVMSLPLLEQYTIRQTKDYLLATDPRLLANPLCLAYLA
jgi:hypothetical protein